MMRYLFLFLFITFRRSLGTNSTTPYYAYQFGSSTNDYSTYLSTDCLGYSLMTGTTDNSLFSPSKGAQDMFLSKHHSTNGSTVWGIQYGSPLPDVGIALTTLSQSLSSSEDILVMGYTTGQLLYHINYSIWYVNYETEYPNYVSEQVELWPGDRLLVTACSYYWGTFTGQPYFSLADSSNIEIAFSKSYCDGSLLLYDYLPSESESPLTTSTSFTIRLKCFFPCQVRVAIVIAKNITNHITETLVDGFLNRYNSITGQMMWNIQYGTPLIDVPYGIAASPLEGDDGVYVVGLTKGSLYNLNPSTKEDLFISKFNTTNGSLIWGYQHGTVGTDYASSVVCDLDGFVYILGYSPTSYSFFNNTSITSSSPSHHSILTMKFSPQGTLIWGKQYGPKDKNNYGTALGLSSTLSALYVSGYTHDGTSFLYKLNLQNGNKIWKKMEEKYFGWKILIQNSSFLYLSSTVLRDNINQYHLSKYHAETGEKLWGIDYAPIPKNYLPKNSYHSSFSIIEDTNQILVTGSISGSISLEEKLSSSSSSSSLSSLSSSYGGVDLLLLSPNICPAGYYSLNYISSCDLCPSNTYSGQASSRCKPCPRGYISERGSAHCHACFGGYYDHGHSICFSRDQDVTTLSYVVPYITISILTILLLLLSCISTGKGTTTNTSLSIGFISTSILSTFDMLSDFLYLTTTFFYNETLFYCAIIFLILPVLLPLFLDLYFKISSKKYQFTFISTKFLQNPSDHSFWSSLRMLIWLIAAIPYLLITLFIGYYLIQTKLLSLPYYERFWHQLFFKNIIQEEVTEVVEEEKKTADVEEEKQKQKQGEDINLQVFNQAVIIEICCEAIPQLIIQSINNILMSSFGLIPQISVLAGILLIMNTLYRIFYFYFIHGIALKDIPLQSSKKKFFEKRFQFFERKKISQHIDTSPLLPNYWVEIPKNSNQIKDSTQLLSDPSRIKVTLEKGLTGIIFKNQRVEEEEGREEEPRNKLIVLFINEDSPCYQAGVRRGYYLDTINDIQYNKSPIQLINESTSRSSCPERCEVVFCSSNSNKSTSVILNLTSQIRSFHEIGLTISHHRSCYSDISYYQVQDVEMNSISYEVGIRPEYRLISVNSKIYQQDIDKELFYSDQKNYFSNFFQKYLTIFQGIFPFSSTSTAPPSSSSSSSASSIVMIFKKSQSTNWVDEWRFDQECFNNHLRDSHLLLITVRNGIPHIGNIPLFFSDTLDNFITFLLYLIVWILLAIIQICWFSLWISYRFLQFPFFLPFHLIKLFSTFSLSFQFYQYLYFFQIFVLIWRWREYYVAPYLEHLRNFRNILWCWGYLTIQLFFVSYLGYLIFHSSLLVRLYYLYLWFAIIIMILSLYPPYITLSNLSLVLIVTVAGTGILLICLLPITKKIKK